MKKNFFIIIFFIFGLTQESFAYSSDPKQFIQEVIDEAKKVLVDTNSKEVKTKKLSEMALKIVDIKGVAYYSLGKDFHLNKTAEFFYQVEGDIILKVMDEGVPKDVHIREGEVYFLPPNVPHSPQRGPNTIGVVIEQKRQDGMKDGLAWYCEECNNNLYTEAFMLKNINTDMPAIFDKYYSSKDLRTCSKCGAIMEPPK